LRWSGLARAHSIRRWFRPAVNEHS
jgi:hypothetical protein